MSAGIIDPTKVIYRFFLVLFFNLFACEFTAILSSMSSKLNLACRARVIINGLYMDVLCYYKWFVYGCLMLVLIKFWFLTK